jgi:hypothetical protein
MSLAIGGLTCWNFWKLLPQSTSIRAPSSVRWIAGKITERRRRSGTSVVPLDKPEGQSTIRAMGFNRRKIEDERRRAAEKVAASRRATDALVFEDAERLIAGSKSGSLAIFAPREHCRHRHRHRAESGT